MTSSCPFYICTVPGDVATGCPVTVVPAVVAQGWRTYWFRLGGRLGLVLAKVAAVCHQHLFVVGLKSKPTQVAWPRQAVWHWARVPEISVPPKELLILVTVKVSVHAGEEKQLGSATMLLQPSAHFINKNVQKLGEKLVITAIVALPPPHNLAVEGMIMCPLPRKTVYTLSRKIF